VKRGVLIATAVLVLLNIGFLLAVLLRPPAKPQEASSVPDEAPSAGQPGVYAVTGVVRELRADGSNIVIRHETIPGFMPAMTMPFTARDPRQVVSLKPGDKVTFRLLVTDNESWIDSVERVGGSPEPTFDLGTSRIVRDVEPLAIGDTVPDYVFTNELGKATQLRDFRGKAVALTFVFTRCPLPDFCPRMVKNFGQMAAALRSREGGPTNWHLVTVTIDPAFDTPEVLHRYAKTYNYDPERWTFLTGALIDIDALTEQVGLVYQRQTSTAFPDHNLRTIVIDSEGRLTKIVIGNTWKPEELVEDVVAAATREPANGE
jgi:protein SCO1/2